MLQVIYLWFFMFGVTPPVSRVEFGETPFTVFEHRVITCHKSLLEIQISHQSRSLVKWVNELLQLSFNRDVNFARFYMDLFASRAIAANVGSDLNVFFGDPATEILIMPPRM